MHAQIVPLVYQLAGDLAVSKGKLGFTLEITMNP